MFPPPGSGTPAAGWPRWGPWTLEALVSDKFLILFPLNDLPMITVSDPSVDADITAHSCGVLYPLSIPASQILRTFSLYQASKVIAIAAACSCIEWVTLCSSVGDLITIAPSVPVTTARELCYQFAN